MFNKNIEILKWIAIGKKKLDAADGNPAKKKSSKGKAVNWSISWLFLFLQYIKQRFWGNSGADPDLKLDFGKALLHRFQLFQN